MKITQHINKLAICIFIASFTLGALLFFLFINDTYSMFHLSEIRFVEIGVLYMIIVFTINVLLLVGLIIHAIQYPIYYKENIFIIGILISNIPISFLFLLIIITMTTFTTAY